MKTFSQCMALMALMIALCVIPCLLPAEIPENVAQIQGDILIRGQQDSDKVTDISACQNGCRMRYGPSPPTGHRATNDGVGKTGKNAGTTVEQSSSALYTQCIEDCERNYWKQFDEETSGSRRRD